MAEARTKQNELSVDAYLEVIADDERRADCRLAVELLSKVVRQEPKMRGTGIVGFGLKVLARRRQS
jgi:hypothetical protein